VDSITKVGTVFLSLETYFARECSLTAQRAPTPNLESPE
jgi:hypothetical protein